MNSISLSSFNCSLLNYPQSTLSVSKLLESSSSFSMIIWEFISSQFSQSTQLQRSVQDKLLSLHEHLPATHFNFLQLQLTISVQYLGAGNSSFMIGLSRSWTISHPCSWSPGSCGLNCFAESFQRPVTKIDLCMWRLRALGVGGDVLSLFDV